MASDERLTNTTSSRAVSPVVGVAILVGITVILASVVGAFVFGLVNIGESAPDASFTFDKDTSKFSTGDPSNSPYNFPFETDFNMRTIRVTQNSGEAISEQQLVAKVSGNKSEPQSNESVYEIDYNGDDSEDDWHLVLNSSPQQDSIFSPGESFTIGFYGIKKSTIEGFSSQTIEDYNTTTNPPYPTLAISGKNEHDGYKIQKCDQIEIVWRSESGAQGQVLQQYRVPGTKCL